MSKWRIEKREFPTGGLFELELHLNYSIYYEGIEEPIYVFKGYAEGNYSGGGWANMQVSGVKKVELLEDQQQLVVFYEDETTEDFPLINPFQAYELSATKLKFLLPFFQKYKNLEEEYNYMDQWSSDISIPADAIKKAELAAAKAKIALDNAFKYLGLSQHQSNLFFDLKKMKRAKIGEEKLLKKFETHLQGHYPK